MKYWSESQKNPVTKDTILEGLKICINGVLVPVLNEGMAKNRNIMPFHKRADIRYTKWLVFATSALLEIADELILDENERIHRMKKEF